MSQVKKIVFSGMFLALCILLPMITGNIPQIGVMLSPIHIPVLLCGFFCGYRYGMAVGIIAPLLKIMIFGMPPLYPIGLAMCCELAVYGLVTGLMYQKLPHKVVNVYTTLLSAMVLGRIAWGLAMFCMFGLKGQAFTLQAFLSGAVLSSIPGIIAHIILIPAIVIAVEKAHLLSNKKEAIERT